MQAGKLRRRLVVEQPTLSAPNEYGDRVKTWATWKTLWVQLEPLQGREAELAKSFAATVSHKIHTRYVAGLLPTFRGRIGSRIFAINAVIDDAEMHRSYTLYVTEIVQPVTVTSPPEYDAMTEEDYDTLDNDDSMGE